MGQSSEDFLELREAESNVTLQDVHDYINGIKQGVLDGELDAITSMYELSEIENNAKLSKGEVKTAAIEEAMNYDEKVFTHKGFKVERRSGRATWNFKNCDEFNNVMESKKEIEKELKARFEIWKKGKAVVDEGTGEQLPVPSCKWTEDTIIIKRADQ